MTCCRLANVILLLAALFQVPVQMHAAETNVVQFTQPAPYTTGEEIGHRFGFAVVPPDYDLSQEHFRIEIPSAQETNRVRGLFVWISPGDDGSFPPIWQEELVKHNLILLAPLQTGDQRHPIDRLRVALDGTCNVCRKYRIDRRRIYVAGYAGGARMASMLGIACGDIFTGTLCICGVNFHLNVPVDGIQYYPGSFYPNPEIVQSARTRGRFVLITGEGDPESDKIKAVADLGFRCDRFKNVTLLQVPGIGQTTPEAATLDHALALLEAGPGAPTTAAQAPQTK